MNQGNRIFAFHLLNDYSGSPKVLSQLIKGWVAAHKEVHLYTSLHQKGFLSDLEHVHYHAGWYRFRANPWLRLVFYALSQLILVVKMFGRLQKNDLVYINTVLPFGAAWVARLKGCRVIYHIHESTVRPAVLRWFLLKTVAYTASDIINVSKYVQNSHGIVRVPNHLVYNALEERYLEQVVLPEKNGKPAHVLMICSLKAYKGIFELFQLAQDNPDYAFRLVLNATPHAMTTFLAGKKPPVNLTLFPAQSDLHPFFRWADVVLNLSRPDGWIETFGLTILEGMAYGLPAIVPPVGGIVEVIETGVTGFQVDSRDRVQLRLHLRMLMEDPAFYASCSRAALQRVSLFRESALRAQVEQVIKSDFNGPHDSFRFS